ncbi:MAG: PEGA domain-containing protein [Candidatus Zixiibacteriota bacterium]
MIFSAALSAQQGDVGLSVVTSPIGAEVFIAGDKVVSGISPVNFQQGFEGNYNVRVKMDGYETYKSSMFFRNGVPGSLNITLKPKTRFKAFSRSFFIPGWGQAYTDHKFKGSLFFLATAGALASFLIADADYDDKANLYDEYLNRYNGMTSIDDKSQFYPILAEARKDAYDAETIRRVTIGATVAVWGLNLLDILFFFPEKNVESRTNGLSLVPDLEQGGGRLVLSHRF